MGSREARPGIVVTTTLAAYGYNIDGVAPGDAAAFCQPMQGASATPVHEEGIDGIENAFGHIVLPLLQRDSRSPHGTSRHARPLLCQALLEPLSTARGIPAARLAVDERLAGLRAEP